MRALKVGEPARVSESIVLVVTFDILTSLFLSLSPLPPVQATFLPGSLESRAKFESALTEREGECGQHVLNFQARVVSA